MAGGNIGLIRRNLIFICRYACVRVGLCRRETFKPGVALLRRRWRGRKLVGSVTEGWRAWASAGSAGSVRTCRRYRYRSSGGDGGVGIATSMKRCRKGAACLYPFSCSRNAHAEEYHLPRILLEGRRTTAKHFGTAEAVEEVAEPVKAGNGRRASGATDSGRPWWNCGMGLFRLMECWKVAVSSALYPPCKAVQLCCLPSISCWWLCASTI